MDARFALIDLAPPDLRRELRTRLATIRASRGQAVVGVAARSTDVFFVAEGEAQVLLYSAQGREVSVRQLGPGDSFGELAALDGLPRSASVVALSDLRLLAMSRGDFLRCVEGSAEAALWLARKQAAEVRRLTERVFELSALNVQTRLHCELLRLARASAVEDGPPCVAPAPTHAELANRIGTHREAVTREIRDLVERNILRAGRRSLEFVDVGRLEQEVGRVMGEAFQARAAG